MRLTGFDFSYIKSFKSLSFDLDQTWVLVGQNDHGKSSILKALDIVLNSLNVPAGASALAVTKLHPDLAERLLPVFPVNAKARRITLHYNEDGNSRRLYVTVRADLSFVIHEKIVRNPQTTENAVKVLERLREKNHYLLIPALRDTSSRSFQRLFSRTLEEYGLSKIIPKKAGGTPREYRALKEIRDRVTETIKPFVDKGLIPDIGKHLGFNPQHTLALKFDIDVQDVGEWIMNNLRLGFQVTENAEATVGLSEAGSGVQSAVLLALYRLVQQAESSPDVNYLFAVEEPEAFLHPQKQKELFSAISGGRTNNVRFLITTHSPYIVSDTPFTKLGLVRKEKQFSTFHTPVIATNRDIEIFDAYSDEVNSKLFFADKVILVEGDSDRLVIETLLRKKLGALAHSYTVLSASGNRNFSPYLRMIRAWSTAGIRPLVVTDFDSLTVNGERAIFKGVKDAGFSLTKETQFLKEIDDAIDKDEDLYASIADKARAFFEHAGIDVFVFTSDLEYALVTDQSKASVGKLLSGLDGKDYSKGYTLSQIRRLIGSKTIPISANNNPPFKKPFVHRKIADAMDLASAHSDIERLLDSVEKSGSQR
jgi:putative ATP-dependent endonuclease of the OLD family